MPVSSPKSRRHPSYYLFALLAALALTGCANQSASMLSSTNSLRAHHLAKTASDPLGSYLNSDIDSTSPYPYSKMPRPSLANTALNQLGIKYKLGGGTPDTGFDCSGLVRYAAEKSLGLKLPRSSAQIAREGMPIERAQLQKGDLVFFNTLGRRFSHVGIYLGNKKFVHAPRTGSVVRIESMDIAYWKNRYNGARRLPNSIDVNTVLTASR